uniref:Putative ovule protein n=1 Tax=Solanum chacoense TaxID=4108 RepID=A0A0V0HJ78_SOLCH
MVEIPSIDSSATTNIAPLKRYAPPSQRNRSLGRQKSGGDRLEQVNSNSNDGEKNQISASRSKSSDDAGGRYQVNGNHWTGLIPLQGCSGNDAFQLLNSHMFLRLILS